MLEDEDDMVIRAAIMSLIVLMRPSVGEPMIGVLHE